MNFCKRCWSSQAKHVKNATRTAENHVFNHVPYTNLRELSKHLQENIIFNDKKLILLNKPAGLKKEKPRDERKLVVQVTPASEKTDHLTFTDVIPYLSKELDLPDLQLIKVPERYSSGISILCNDEFVRRKIKRGLGDVSLPLFTYLAVCVGVPLKLSDNTKLGATLVDKSGMRKVILVKNYSKRSIIQEKTVPLIMIHDTLSVNEDLNVSLVRIINNRNKWSGLRAYFAQRLLSPILGDSLHGSCVQILKNKSMPVNPFSPIANFPPKLPAKILSALQVAKKDQIIVPLHLHLAQLNLLKFGEDGTTFIAKPPDYFLWTCERFNLTVPELYLRNGSASLNSLTVDENRKKESLQ